MSPDREREAACQDRPHVHTLTSYYYKFGIVCTTIDYIIYGTGTTCSMFLRAMRVRVRRKYASERMRISHILGP